MAEYAEDVYERSDIIAASGVRSYKFFAGGGHSPDLTPAQRATLLAASGTWAALRTAWVGIHPAAGAWLDSLSGDSKEALRVSATRPLIP